MARTSSEVRAEMVDAAVAYDNLEIAMTETRERVEDLSTRLFDMGVKLTALRVEYVDVSTDEDRS